MLRFRRIRNYQWLGFGAGIFNEGGELTLRIYFMRHTYWIILKGWGGRGD